MTEGILQCSVRTSYGYLLNLRRLSVRKGLWMAGLTYCFSKSYADGTNVDTSRRSNRREYRPVKQASETIWSAWNVAFINQ